MKPSQHAQPSPWTWRWLCTGLALLCVLVWWLPVETQIALRWQAHSWQQQPWTLWTASLTHLSDMHLAVNLFALLCLAIIGDDAGAGRAESAALMLAWPLSNLALLLWPTVQMYAGFSAVNHALGGVLIARAALDLIASRRFRVIIFLFALLLLAKLIWEAPWHTPLRPDASWGFTVVQAGHLTGAVSGLLCAALVYGLARIFFTKAVVE